MAKAFSSGQINKGGIHIQARNQITHFSACLLLALPSDPHWNPHRFLVHGDLVAEPVVTEVIAIIGKKDDEGVFTQSQFIKLPDKRAHLVIEMTDGRVVGLDELLHQLVMTRGN